MSSHWIETRTLGTPLPADPSQPAPRDKADHRAFKAMANGTASPEQQKMVLGWLIFASGYRVQPYRPGPAGERDTTFALGMRHIGVQIYEMLETQVRGSGDDEQGTR